MPKYIFKDGNIPSEFFDYLLANEKSVIVLEAEIETNPKRLRGAFHAVLTHWFNSGMYSCMWNNKPIQTFEGLKKYYKYHGCQGQNVTYAYAGEQSSDLSFFKDNLPEYHHRFIVCTPRPWEKMTNIQKCRSLNIMLSEIKQSGDLTPKLEKSLAILNNDVEALQSIGYYQYCKKNVRS